MFENFSQRSKLVIFAARAKAGERGANMIEIDDFIVALVLEDQGLEKGQFPKLFGIEGPFHSDTPPHAPFFAPEMANELVNSLESVLPKSPPVSRSMEMRLSPALERIFDSALALQTQLHHSQVQPLHLLATILTKESSHGVKLLQKAGITEEIIVQKLRSDSSLL